MQNPFRQHRPQDDFGRRDHEDQGRWEARDPRWDERSSWSEGDGGRGAEASGRQGQYGQSYGQDREMSGARGMGYGQHQQSQYGGGMSTGWTGDRQPRQGSSYDQYGYGSQASGQQQSWGQPQYGRGDAGAWSGGSGDGGGSMDDRQHWNQGGGYGQSSGYSQGGSYGGASMGDQSGMRTGFAGGSQMQGGSQSGSASHGYAPGSQIWDGSGSGVGGQTHEHHDFEPDYLHWRQQQLSAFDDDYRSWRDERRQKFSSDFSSWRQNRPRSQASGEHHTPAENPIVGDVSDGGSGDASEAKKRQ